MTKMPDKIDLTKLKEALEINSLKDLREQYEAGRKFIDANGFSPFQIVHEAAQAYRDIIPQPVTDEARAKALALIEDYAENNKRNLKIATPVMVKDLEERALIYDTIKAALSQPSIPVQSELEALKAENQKLHDKVVYTEGRLSVYVEEYPKVVAERDDLRRAVVDLAMANGEHEDALAYAKHAATIDQAIKLAGE